MTKCRIIYKNLWRRGTIIAYTSQDPQFPAANTKDDNAREMVYRSAAGVLTITIDNDLGSALQYDYVALLNHNISATVGVTIQIKGADNAAFTTNVVTDTLTYNGNNLRAYLGTVRTKRYVRISIADASNPSNYIQIGVIVVGKYFEPGRSFGPRMHGRIDESQTTESPSTAMFTVLSKPKPQGMTLIFKGESDSDWAEFMLLFNEVGIERALEVCFDYNAPNSNSYWIVILSLELPERAHYDYWTITLTVKEHA